MHTTRRSVLMFAGVVAITAVSPRRAFSQLLPTLPPALADVKALLRAATKVAVINVNGLTQVHTQVLKCGELEFASNAVLEFAALDFDWIALYADVIKLTGAATVRTDWAPAGAVHRSGPRGPILQFAALTAFSIPNTDPA